MFDIKTISEVYKVVMRMKTKNLIIKTLELKQKYINLYEI